MAAVFIAAGTPEPAGAQTMSDLGIEVRRLSSRTVMVNAGPWNNSYVAIATQKGIVVIDSGFSKTVAQAVRAAIQAEFKRSDFAFLVNSHEHSDHTFGDGAYSDVPIVGSDLMHTAIQAMKSAPAIVAERLAIPEQSLAGIRQELAKDPRLADSPRVAQGERFWKTVQADYSAGVEFVPPTITFDRRMALNMGDVSVHLFSFGHWHSDADTIISIPEEGIVRLGAILYANHLPIVKNPHGPKGELTAAMVERWITALNEVLAEADEKTQFISCHGWAVMSKAQCAPQIAYIQKLWTEVRRSKAAGKTLQQAEQALTRARAFPEVAGLEDTGLQVTNIHEHNVEALWNAAR